MCTHKMMTAPDTSINRAVYACIIRSITRSSLLLIEQTVITAIMMKNSAIATSKAIINPFILKCFNWFVELEWRGQAPPS